MPSIKIIDLPPPEYFSEAEVKGHLTQLLESLREVRKEQYRQSLRDQSDDEIDRQVEEADLDSKFEVMYFERSNILRRSLLLVKARKTAHGLDGLKDREIERLVPSAKGAKAVTLASEHQADEIAAELHDAMPWFGPATEAVWHQMRACASSGEPVMLGPILLDGPPGIGKSHWARKLAELLAVPCVELDVGKVGAGFAVTGTERGWGTAQPGCPIEVLLQHRIANPIIVVDEICKTYVANSTKERSFSIADAMLSLLEKETARTWECPFFRKSFNMSHVSWLLTANSVKTVPAPLLSRCQVIELPEIDVSHLVTFVERFGLSKGLTEASIGAIVDAIGQSSQLGRPLSLRDVSRMLERATVLQAKPRLQ